MGIQCVMTAASHASGTDRIAEVAAQRGWPDEHHRRQRARRRAAHRARADPRGGRRFSIGSAEAIMSTACHALHRPAGSVRSERGESRAGRARRRAVLQPRHNPLGARCLRRGPHRASRRPSRSTGTSASTHIAAGSCKRLHRLEPPAIERFEALEQLRALWHGLPNHRSDHRSGAGSRRGHPGGPGDRAPAVRVAAREPIIASLTARSRIPERRRTRRARAPTTTTRQHRTCD